MTMKTPKLRLHFRPISIYDEARYGLQHFSFKLSRFKGSSTNSKGALEEKMDYLFGKCSNGRESSLVKILELEFTPPPVHFSV